MPRSFSSPSLVLASLVPSLGCKEMGPSTPDSEFLEHLGFYVAGQCLLAAAP